MSIFKRFLALIIMIAIFLFPIPFSAFADEVEIRIGVVGMVSPFSGIRPPTSTDDFFLSAACDSLYSLSMVDAKISPMLAESWPIFDESKKTVTVKIIQATVSPGAAGIGIDAYIKALMTRIPDGSGITVRSDQTGHSMIFAFRDDASLFWNLFAFAPIWATGIDGAIAGAGSPPFRVASFEGGFVRLEASDAVSPAITITGFPDEKSMLDAFTSGKIDYARTGLTKSAASIKGLSWQSESPAVISLVFNSKSPTFTDASARAAASGMLDVPYLVLRALNGSATAARGIYFQYKPGGGPSAGAGLLAGKKISLLVDSVDRSSLEMLCALLIESWWEKGGATVSITIPKSQSELYAFKNIGTFDAMISSIWLQPAFRGLFAQGLGIGTSALSWGGWNGTERLEAANALKFPKSYEHLNDAARKLESMMLDGFSVIPLIRPLISELYQPSVLKHLNQSPGLPLLGSLRDLADRKSY